MDNSTDTNSKQVNQALEWSDAELRRASRVFELLKNINERIKKGAEDEEVKEK